MARQEDPVIGELVEGYAKSVSEMERALAAIKEVVAIDVTELKRERFEIDSSMRQAAATVADTLGKMKLFQDSLRTIAAQEAKNVSADMSTMIAKNVGAAVGANVVDQVGLAIRERLGPEIESHSKEAVAMVNSVSSAVADLRPAIVRLRLLDVLSATIQLAVWIAGIAVGLGFIFLVTWKWVLQPMEAKETEKRSEYLMLAATQFDEDLKARVDVAYQKAVSQAAAAAKKAAEQAELDRIAQVAAKEAMLAETAAEQTREILNKQKTATLAAETARMAAEAAAQNATKDAADKSPKK